MVCRLLICGDSLVAEQGSRALRIQELGLPGSRAQARRLWYTGLVVLRHVLSSWTRIKSVSSALTGGSSTTEAPGKPPPVFSTESGLPPPSTFPLLPLEAGRQGPALLDDYLSSDGSWVLKKDNTGLWKIYHNRTEKRFPTASSSK